MSERKVLTKYYPPDWDPSKISRVKGPKSDKLPTVRLMTPFAMRCTRCGTFIPKSKKFNARKQTPEGDKYLGIQKFRFFFRCPGCHGEISFKTDPKNMDYEAESGAQRNFEPWREGHIEETDEERLQRLEAEEVEVDAMQDLETKMHDAQRDMAVADALDEIRAANARNEKAVESDHKTALPDVVVETVDQQDLSDTEAARLAFEQARQTINTGLGSQLASDTSSKDGLTATIESVTPQTVPSFKRVHKTKKNHSAALGIKKKT